MNKGFVIHNDYSSLRTNLRATLFAIYNNCKQLVVMNTVVFSLLVKILLKRTMCLETDAYSCISTISGGFWAIILSWAVWKKIWVGHDPTQSKMAADRIVATTGIAVWAQQLTT